MAKIMLKEVADKKGRTLYWLHQQTGIAHKTLYRYAHGKSSGIQLADIDKICTALKCTVGQLIEVEKAELIQG